MKAYKDGDEQAIEQLIENIEYEISNAHEIANSTEVKQLIEIFQEKLKPLLLTLNDVYYRLKGK